MVYKSKMLSKKFEIVNIQKILDELYKMIIMNKLEFNEHKFI